MLKLELAQYREVVAFAQFGRVMVERGLASKSEVGLTKEKLVSDTVTARKALDLMGFVAIKGFGGMTSKSNFGLTKDRLVKDRGATKEALYLHST